MQIGFLQLALLVGAAALIGGGYYLVTTGKLQVEGLSPVANRVEAKDIGFYNEKDTRVIFFDNDKFGMPQIIFLDAQKRLRMRLKVFPDGDGSGGLAFYDATGWRGVLRMEGDETSVLKLVGKKQKGGIAMAVTPDGTPSLKMTDKDGKVLWEAPAKSQLIVGALRGDALGLACVRPSASIPPTDFIVSSSIPMSPIATIEEMVMSHLEDQLGEGPLAPRRHGPDVEPRRLRFGQFQRARIPQLRAARDTPENPNEKSTPSGGPGHGADRSGTGSRGRQGQGGHDQESRGEEEAP